MASRESDEVVVVGARHRPLRDAYHWLLRIPWWGLVLVIVASFLSLNVLFALGYARVGGVMGVRPGLLRDDFFFSVQTMGTIGYGAMYPASDGAHSLVVAESVVSLIFTALSTGIVFARFSRSISRVIFSTRVCISPMNGVPTLAFRIGNDRASTIFEAIVRVSLIRTERTAEGVVFYRLVDLVLSRERSPALARSWTVLHPITPESPLFGMSPTSCKLQEVELVATVVGTDDTSLQPVHARHRYLAADLVWGARLADVLRELPDGRLELDVRKFDAIAPSEKTEAFPYGA